MRLGADGSHLTYCSNIHPGETWAEVRANIERFFRPCAIELFRASRSASDCGFRRKPRGR